ADVTASASFSQSGLPDTADDFVAAVLGLRANTWLNLFQQARAYTSLDEIREKLDTLAVAFVERYTGKAFDEIESKADLASLLADLEAVADVYESADERAVALFDRYFDAASGAVSDTLTKALDAIGKVTSWDSLKSQVDPVVWDVLTQLTGGDPL